MILNFHGGVRPDERTVYDTHNIEYITDCSAVCISANDDAYAVIDAGTEVKKGTLVGYSDETPVYAPISGIFRGKGNISGGEYFVIVSDRKNEESAPFEPESRALTSLSREDITESAKKLAIYDARSGMPLWRLLEKLQKCRRVVIDCTESDAKSAINYRLCVEKAKSIVGGAKILLQATGALKCVFAVEYYRTEPIEALAEFAYDDKLFAAATLAEKYPYTDSSLMYALYIKTLKSGEAALDKGVLIVSAETACALYDAMVSGMPQTVRYISYCGRDASSGGNICVPRGITLRDILLCFDSNDKNSVNIENSLLSGKRFESAVSDSTRAIINVIPDEKPRAVCVSCGKCIEACPVRLVPRDVLTGTNTKLEKRCIECGACEFICPSGIPLLKLIKNKEEPDMPEENNLTEVE